VVGVDAKLSHLLAARRLGSPQVGVVAEASALPLADRSVACAFSHLFFHHLDPAGNRGVVEEMRRVARRAAVVVDLRRSALSRLLARPCLRLLAISPTAYHDGVASVQSAYGLDEVAAVVDGLPVRELRRRFPFRWSLVVAGSDG
jgi:ubiquinone/menaquinone biosynthesis C-methylase UbiE